MSKVLYICSARNFRQGNVMRKMLEMVDCWKRMGHDVVYLWGGDLYASPSSDDRDPSKVADSHNRWYRKMSLMAPLVHSLSEWRDIKHNRRMRQQVEQIVRQEKPDLIFERSNRLSTSGLDVAQKFGLPFVLEWKDHLIDYRLSLFRLRAGTVERRKNREADLLVAESEVLRQQLALQGVDAENILVAHNAVSSGQFVVDEQSRSKQRDRFGVRDDQVLVGYMGGYAFYHNMLLLVEAADLIRQRGRSDISFLLIGRGLQHESVRRRAEELGLLGNIIRMEPWVPKDQVPGVLAAFDVAVLPGCTDIICPIKVQEYMAVGLASIIPDYACNREVMEHNHNGWLFDPDSTSALANGIATLADDKALRKRLGEKARQDVTTRFSWENTWGHALEDALRRLTPGDSTTKSLSVQPQTSPHRKV